MSKVSLWLLLMSVALSTGCAIKRPVSEDYNQYLLNNDSQSELPTTDLEAKYLLDSKTINHKYEFRSAKAGIANVWVVEFGKMLDETLKANYVKEAFGKLEQVEGNNNSEGNLISFSLESYQFKDNRASVSLNISLSKGSGEILNKTYHSTGKTQGAKMFWGGVFAMKNATQQSTKLAIDKILTEFIQDINVKHVSKSK